MNGADTVTIAAPRPDWPAAFEAEADRIRQGLASIGIALHHIGSTAVPDLPAKPIVDILAEADLAELDGQRAAFEGLGYEPLGEYGIRGRRYFRRIVNGTRTHHLHAFAPGSPHITRHLAFRDYLIAHPTVATRYGALKAALADDGEAWGAYQDGKAPFIQLVEGAALRWARVSAARKSELC